MKTKIAMATALLLVTGIAFGQGTASPSTGTKATPGTSCEARAVDKNGKPLAGAAKASFMKKCEAGNSSGKIASCEAKAVDKNGKPLVGAAKTSFMKKCEAAAG